ncbi:MAG: hypothetical protein NC930_03645, partial [Candidatus Omnitrophica bacterium]|nr:hypothetical protein [Candidatus Omnitrophota bacterium]
HYQERIFFAKKAVELAPRDPNALRSLAWAWWISGDEAKAIDTYKKLKEIDPLAFQQVLDRVLEIKKAIIGD